MNILQNNYDQDWFYQRIPHPSLVIPRCFKTLATLSRKESISDASPLNTQIPRG
jgi:hypothetical protein